MKKIIVLTGSFNPVTIAHYTIMSDAVEKFQADEGVFIATNKDYLTKKAILKTKPAEKFILSEETRAGMIKSLKKDNPKLDFWGFEIGRDSPSTYKTLVKFMKDKKKQYPGEEIKLYFLLGADKLSQISHWNDIEAMSELSEYLVYARNIDLEGVINADEFLTKIRERIHLLQVNDEDIEDVSSTIVRRKFFAGENYSELMNDGPYNILKTFTPEDFPEITDEDIIKAQLKYGGQFGKNAARLQVFKTNKKMFDKWNERWLGDRDEHRKAKVYKAAFSVNAPDTNEETVIGCVNADCAEGAKKLIDEGFNPALLNLASNTSPGGGYHKGEKSQEESLCQMSTLSQSLYQFGDPKYKHIKESGLKTVPGVYPMDINFGGIYSPCVTFFRENIDNGFGIREEKFDCSVVTVASLKEEEAKKIGEGWKEIEKNKIRTLLRIALDNGHDSMVLGAFGCGWYSLECNDVAEFFRDVLNEQEFKNKFKKLVFAIYEGKPSPRKPPMGKFGKYAPFYDIFGELN